MKAPQNDIFISYAHIDNASFSEDEEGWVTQLHRILELRLAQLMGEQARVWRDQKLKGNDIFDETLEERFRNTKLLISIVSPRYVKSDWCIRELNGFSEVAPPAGDRSRVFKVVKTPVDLDRMPEQFQRTLGYEFYKKHPETGRPLELSLDQPETRKDFLARLDDLAYEIVELLQELRNGTPADPHPEGRTIYLAETSFDAEDERDALKRDLLEKGHRVLPNLELPDNAPGIDRAVNEALAESDLSIHIVGGYYGVVPAATEYSVVHLQDDIAADHAEQSPQFMRLIWLPANRPAREERQQKFLHDLHNDPRAAGRTDIVHGTLEEFKEVVEETLKNLRSREARAEERGTTAKEGAASANENAGSVYLIYCREDEEEAYSLAEYLFEVHGLNVMTPLLDGAGDESELREDHRENLVSCDAVIIFYGSAEETWLREKLRELKKIPGYGRDRPFSGRAVFLAPPATPHKTKRLLVQGVEIIRSTDEIRPETLEDFAIRIKEKSGAEASA